MSGPWRTTLDDLYPQEVWELPVDPAFPAPRLATPPPERSNTIGYRDYYGSNLLAEIGIPGAEGGRIGVVDKAWPHSLYDVMLLPVQAGACSGVGDTPAGVLAGMLAAADAWVRFLSDAAVVGEYGLADYRATCGWNHDLTLDRDNGQWWDKTMHWHLNTWAPRSGRRPTLRDVPDIGVRRSLVDPIAYLAHQVLLDAVYAYGLPSGCRPLTPDPRRDAEQHLPVGLKIDVGGWAALTGSEGAALLHALHDVATVTYKTIRGAFTGRSELASPAWERPGLLPVDQVAVNLARLSWLSEASFCGLLKLRAALKDVDERRMRLLAARPALANRFLTLGGVSYNLTYFTPQRLTADGRFAQAERVYLVLQAKLVSYVGHSPAAGNACASIIDRWQGPVMSDAEHARRRAFQLAYADVLHSALAAV